MDTRLADTLALPWRVRCAGLMSSAAQPLEIIPEYREKHSGLLRKTMRVQTRNSFHLQSGILFAFAPMKPCPAGPDFWAKGPAKSESDPDEDERQASRTDDDPVPYPSLAL